MIFETGVSPPQALHEGPHCVVTGEKPAAPIQKGLPELQAQVAVNQYGDRLPLQRQQSIYQRQGG